MKAARDEARRLKKQVDQGDDPLAQIETARTAPTVADLSERYVAEHLPKKRPSQPACRRVRRGRP